jgi:hypothetical protein
MLVTLRNILAMLTKMVTGAMISVLTSCPYIVIFEALHDHRMGHPSSMERYILLEYLPLRIQCNAASNFDLDSTLLRLTH